MRFLLLAFSIAIVAACSTRPLQPPAPIPIPTQPAIPSITEAPAEPAKPVENLPRYIQSTWSQLPHWEAADAAMLQNSWLAWQQSCSKLQRRPAFSDMCAVTKNMSPNIDAASIKSFFEKYFQPWKIEGTQSGSTGLITGYYEAFLSGGRQQAPNRVPLYAEPDDLLTVELGDLFPELKGKRVRARLQGKKVVPYWTRAEINQGLGPRADKVLVWADDTIAAFFLEVQGSGRVQLDDGSIIRLGYANQNGQPYRSIGRWLADQGEIPIEQVSMQRIQAWALANPDRLPELLAQNPSYVFFRIIPDNHLGPIGALNVPLTAEASIAVDPKFIPLGSPVWLDSTEPSSETPMQRLVHAQDTGGAIRGPVRADFYWGSGNEAGAKAGITKQKGQMWVLLPLSQLPPYSSAEKNPSDP